MNDGYTYDRAEAVRIESDEHGFELHIDTTMHGQIVLNIHGIVEDLYGEVVREVIPYLAEKQRAYAEFKAFGGSPDLYRTFGEDEIEKAREQADLLNKRLKEDR